MLVLFDQGTPVTLRQHLAHHTVRTVFQEGWATLANGDLLTAAEAAGFEAKDKNLRYQQDLSGRRIAVVVIGYAQWPGLEPHVDLVVAAVDNGVNSKWCVLNTLRRRGLCWTISATARDENVVDASRCVTPCRWARTSRT